MSSRKGTPFKADRQIKLRPEILGKISEEVRRLAKNGTAQGRRYADALCQKYPQLRNA